MAPLFIIQQNPMELLKDIRPQEELNYNFLNLILFILACMLLLGTLMYLFYKVFSYKKKDTENESVVLIETSLEEELPKYLEMLAKVQKNKEPVKFYVILNFIFRLMLEKKFKFNALEFTTGEILREMKKKEIYKNHFDPIKDFLKRSDMVKFYDYIPEEKTIENDHKTYLNMIKEKTKLNKSLSELFKKAENI